MKQTIAIGLLLGLFTANAFALPSQGPMPILSEARDSQSNVQPHDRHVAEGGSERTPGQQRIRVAEGGAERTIEQRLRTAEGGSERTPGQQRIRVAEGGAERTLAQRIG